MNTKISCLGLVMAMGLIMAVLCSSAMAQQTKYAAGLSSAAVVFAGDVAGKCVVDSIYSTTDKAGACVKVYARGGAAPVAPDVAPTNGQTVIALQNSTYGLTNSDMVVYAHENGVLDYSTVSSATTSNITLGTALSQAGSLYDRVFEIQLKAQFDFDTSGAAVGTNKFGSFSGAPVFAGEGPIRVIQDGTSNAVINVTVR